jgi:tetratricopeptide (TPR) repeat protein
MGRWGTPPPPAQTPILDKLRWALILLVAGGVIAVLVMGGARKAADATPLSAYQRDVSLLEKEYGVFYGRLLREPELEQQFHAANDFVRQQNYMAAIEVLERVAKVAAVPVIFQNLGSLYAAVGDRARSMGAFREALARDAEYRPVRDAMDGLRLFAADEALPVRQEIEPNNSEISANLIGLDRQVDGEIVAGDTDSFRFVTPPAPRDILQVDVENVDQTLEMSLRVHDGELQNDSGRIIGEPGKAFRKYVSQPPNQSLFLILSSTHNTAGRYRITIKPLRSFDRLEPNDDIFAARRIEIGQPYEANIMDSEDTDFYSFQAMRTGTVTIEVKNESATLIPAITTFGTDRRTTGFGPDIRKPGADLKHTMEVTDFQVYYVQVWSQGRTSGRYTLTIR